MKFTIHKNTHRAKPLYWLRWFPMLINRLSVSRKVMFDFSAKYDIGHPDQADVNKLFGISHGGIHKHSARFGWNYDKEVNKFNLFAYIYNNGVREFHPLCRVVANHFYECSISWSGRYYMFTVLNESGDKIACETKFKSGRRNWGWLLGLYFGGNRKAPHTIIIQIKK